MNLTLIETFIRWLGGVFALLALAAIFAGIWQGTRRPAGKTTGSNPGWLRSPRFYLLTGCLYFAVCILLWRSLPISLSPPARVAASIAGSLLYFPGMAFTLWCRLALGRMYFVSTGMGAQLFAGHRLVTHGPYAIVRHPMYFGITLAAIGGLLLYQTWTMIFFLLLPFGLTRRARIEEQVLADEFGSQWSEYSRRVPALIPRLRIFKS